MSGSNVDRRSQSQALPATVYSRMGDLLGIPITSEVDAWLAAERGISVEQYVTLAGRLRLAADAVAPATTMRRRLKMLGRRDEPRQVQAGPATRHRKMPVPRAEEARLTHAETERAMRIARVAAEAIRVFGDEAVALSWLHEPGDFLQDGSKVTPLALAKLDCGACVIESFIKRAEYGMF